MSFFSQILEEQIAVILKKFQYSQILNRSEHEKKVVYNQFLTRLENAVRREMKFLVIFIDFFQRDRKAFKNVNVFILFRDFFFTSIAHIRRIRLSTIENAHF